MNGFIVIIGSGMMTPAMVDYFVKEKVKITMVNIDLEMTKNVLKNYENTTAVHWINCDPVILENAIIESKSNIVISMIPPDHHYIVAKSCVKLKKNLITCSYEESPSQLRKLEKDFIDNNIYNLNELGECPGLDHMLTTLLIEEVRKKNGKISKIDSYGSGIPAHESNNNPFFYKYNWSLKGLMHSSKIVSNYLKNGNLHEVEGAEKFENYKLVDIPNLGTFECYANRKMEKYLKYFGLGNTSSMSFFRGLLRHPGYCSNFKYLIRLGLLEDTVTNDFENLSYSQAIGKIIGYNEKNVTKKELRKAVAEFLKIDESADIIHRLEWLGLFSDESCGLKKTCNVELLLKKMTEKLKYTEDDKDLVICHTEVTYIDVNNEKKKIWGTISLKGVSGGFSAMTRAVGYCCAISTKWLMNHETCKIGMITPCGWVELSKYVLQELGKYGFKISRNE